MTKGGLIGRISGKLKHGRGNIVLTGFMGTGKSAVGRLLARELDLDFVDMDALIEAEAGTTIREIFKKDGEESFRDIEAGVIKKLASGEFGDALVVATGGGAVLRPSNREMLKRWGTVICLTATVDAIIARVDRGSHRPLLDGHDRRGSIERLLAERATAYADCHATFDTTADDAAGVVDGIVEWLSNHPHA